jgi:hypothetical protein
LVTLGSILKIEEVAQFFGFLFSMVKVMYYFQQKKMGWATFWASFSTAHPVTLVASSRVTSAIKFDAETFGAFARKGDEYLSQVTLYLRRHGDQMFFFNRSNASENILYYSIPTV